ncbi:MAG: M48 family metalloprotease, partial [Pseudomonadota bacterium]
MNQLGQQLTICFALLMLWGSVNVAVAGPSGRQIYEEMMLNPGPYPDPALQAYIRELGQRIVAISEKPNEDFTFTVLDDPSLNAFATADNYVYMNRGLMNYMRNEAQLVSVLAHEVGHITEGHVDFMQGKAFGAQALAAIVAVLAGSNEVYEAGMDYANALTKGRGRDNELEADAAGARYMTALGYDPNEIIEMLSTMTDIQRLQRERARAAGAGRQTYHGIYYTHPRNDARLRAVVARAARADADVGREKGRERFQQMTEGLVWGENFQAKEQIPERWSNLQKRIRFDFPKGWQHQTHSPGMVTGSPGDGGASLSMSIKPRTTQTPEEYLYNQLNVSSLRDGKEISPARLKGFTGVVPGEGGAPDRRIAVIYYKLDAYVFNGNSKDLERFREFDEQFLDTID